MQGNAGVMGSSEVRQVGRRAKSRGGRKRSSRGSGRGSGFGGWSKISEKLIGRVRGLGLDSSLVRVGDN